MYLIKLTQANAEFIGKYFADDVIPKVTEEPHFFVFGVVDEKDVYSILSATECDKLFGPPSTYLDIRLYKTMS